MKADRNLPPDYLTIDPDIYWELDSFTLPDRLGFGSTLLPVMYKAVCINGEWVSRTILPYQPIQLDPAAKVLHYAQEIFEGMKAYNVAGNGPSLFRPMMNAERFNQSATRMCMPEVPIEIFMEGVSTITALAESHIPSRSGQSLYLRPFMIGVDPTLMLGPSAKNEFYVIASPSEIYHQGSMKVMIEWLDSRASVGGTGHVKVGGNYAAALASSRRAVDQGYDQTLWLDPTEHCFIEELSGMNVFAVIDGEIHTPLLSGSILPGITRDSIISLAKNMGYSVHERQIDIRELLALIECKKCSELFACGTAAVITPISELGQSSGERVTLTDKPIVADKLCKALVDIQEGRGEDALGWNFPIPETAYFADMRYANAYSL